ncbi:29918_t:CDS:2, partial [Racocetra persica]
MGSLKEWFIAAVCGEEFDEIRYDDLRELFFIDRGGFGEVYSANCVSINKTVAVKKIFQSYLEKQDVFDAFIKELKLHKQLGDSNRIINFLGISKDPNDGSHLIVMEFADSGSLQQFLNRERNNLQWTEKLSLAQQLAEGVAYIHSKDIVHRARESPISNTPIKYMKLYKRCWETEPELRPDISEIVVRLSTMRLEPVYGPLLPVNNRHVKTLSPPINMGHHSTLIFDENLAIPCTPNNKKSPDDVNCERCGQKFTNEWCKNCECKRFRKNFDYWTSGNKQLNELIKKSQLEATYTSNYIEWIENDQLEDIENIVKGRLSTVKSAVWRNGPREVWDEETGQWERASKTKVAIKYLKTSGSDFQTFLNEVKLHVCCDKVIRCYGITKDYQTGEYGTELLGIITAWNYSFRDKDQFDSANRKVRGFKKRPFTTNDKLYYTSKALSTKLISKLKHQSVKYESIEYKFDQNYLIVKGENVDFTELQNDKDDNDDPMEK